MCVLVSIIYITYIYNILLYNILIQNIYNTHLGVQVNQFSDFKSHDIPFSKMVAKKGGIYQF